MVIGDKVNCIADTGKQAHQTPKITEPQIPCMLKNTASSRFKRMEHSKQTKPVKSAF